MIGEVGKFLSFIGRQIRFEDAAYEEDPR